MFLSELVSALQWVFFFVNAPLESSCAELSGPELVFMPAGRKATSQMERQANLMLVSAYRAGQAPCRNILSDAP